MKKLIANFFNPGITLREFLIIFLGCGLFVLSMPPYGYFLLGFVSLIPLLIVLKDKSILVSFRLGVVFGFITYTISLFWLFRIFNLFSLSLYCILAAFIGIFALLFSLIQKYYNYRFALIVSPVIWMAVEFFKSEQWKLKFGWLSLGYTQHSNKYFLMMAKYIGVYGVSAVILAVSVLLLLLFKYKDFKNRIIVFFILTTIIAFALYSNRQVIVLNNNKIFFRLVQVEDDFDKCLNLALKSPIKNKSVIVFPEYSIIDSPLQNPELKNKILNFIENAECYLIFGCIEFLKVKDKKNFFNNIALIFSPAGKIIGKFQKHHPIQFFQDGQAGSGYPVFKTEIGTLGLGICYDFTYEDVARNLTKKGAQVLINPALDGSNWSKAQHIQHAMMIPFRAVETGRFLVRAAAPGISMIISPRGDVLQQIESGKEGVIDCEVPLLKEKTFYVKGGYLLSYLSQIIIVLIIMIGVWKKKPELCMKG
ncbi:hypothetical protein KAI68_06985 [bacterium]|nr:hypothetical protein [bacterium]